MLMSFSPDLWIVQRAWEQTAWKSHSDVAMTCSHLKSLIRTFSSVSTPSFYIDAVINSPSVHPVNTLCQYTATARKTTFRFLAVI